MLARQKALTTLNFARCHRLLSTQPKLKKPEKGIKTNYDVVIVGGGHNGLISASYLAAAGYSVGVFERRGVVGGAAVTEEIVPGFKFSRASYLLSLLRPTVWRDLNLDDYDIKLHFRDPHSYTPLLQKQNGHSSLLLGNDPEASARELAKFSQSDAQAYAKYEDFLGRMVNVLEPLFFDMEPLNVDTLLRGGLLAKWREIKKIREIRWHYKRNMSPDMSPTDMYELLTAPISKVLDFWFESDVLKASLATDGMIGALLGVDSPGSGYVLLHHVMGGVGGHKGAWAYVEGGMGALTDKLAQVAEDRGVHIYTNQPVKSIEIEHGKCRGIITGDNKFISAKAVLSNATPDVTYLKLVKEGQLPKEFIKKVKGINYESGVAKINVATKAVPNFTANPNTTESGVMPHHFTTIHLNTETMGQLQKAYTDAMLGKASERPMIEMTIPSSLDSTLAPKGCHVVQLFTQFAPYKMPEGFTKEDYAKRCFDQIEEYAPGFKSSIVGYEVLCPADIEREFGLTGGNIFHGAMSLDQLYFSRTPVRAPVKGLYLCGSGSHPGGGVMGAPGQLAAKAVIEDKQRKHL